MQCRAYRKNILSARLLGDKASHLVEASLDNYIKLPIYIKDAL